MAELEVKGTRTPTRAETEEGGELEKSSTYSYPNPFDDETTIRFIMREDLDVHIRIYDINDAPVWHKDIPGSAVGRGLNTVIWKGINDNGENAANGVYILEIAAGKKSVKKLMSLVRSAE